MTERKENKKPHRLYENVCQCWYSHEPDSSKYSAHQQKNKYTSDAHTHTQTTFSHGVRGRSAPRTLLKVSTRSDALKWYIVHTWHSRMLQIFAWANSEKRPKQKNETGSWRKAVGWKRQKPHIFYLHEFLHDCEWNINDVRFFGIDALIHSNSFDMKIGLVGRSVCLVYVVLL